MSLRWLHRLLYDERGDAPPAAEPCDDGVGQHTVVELENQAHALTASDRQPRSVLYRREMSLAIMPARDAKSRHAPAQSALLARAFGTDDDDDDDDGSAVRERGWSSKIDEQICLADLLTRENRLDDDDDDDGESRSVGALRESGGGERDEYAMLVELALVVLDEDAWDPQHMYLLIEAERVGPLQRTQMCVGNRDAVLRAVPSSAPLDFERKNRLRGRTCALNGEARVDGWCRRCGLQPSMVTIYQSPLGDRDLLHYAPELCAPAGTHGNVARLDAERGLIEVVGDSTLLEDVRESAESAVVDECYNSEAGEARESGVAFVDVDAWQKELAARRYVLNNLPLVRAADAHVRVAARSAPSAQKSSARSLRIVLTAQCIEFAP